MNEADNNDENFTHKHKRKSGNNKKKKKEAKYKKRKEIILNIYCLIGCDKCEYDRAFVWQWGAINKYEEAYDVYLCAM